MFIPFESLPSSARIWIFQAARPLSSEDVRIAEERLRAFTDQWSVHGSPLRTSFRIAYDRFIVLAADESGQSASGCSIDSSARAVKEVGELLGVDLFDRTLVAFKVGAGVLTLPLQEARQKFNDGTLTGDTLTFNNLLTTKEEFDKCWVAPVRDSWLKRYLVNPLAKVQ